MSAETSSIEQARDANRSLIVTAIVRSIVFVLLQPGLLFVSAGTLNWFWGWLYVGLTISATLGGRLVLLRKDPDLIAERFSSPKAEDTKRWDKVIVPLVAIYLPLVTLVVAGLDFRFGWSPAFSLPAYLIAVAVLVWGYSFGTWAMLANRFFSSSVRIQTDRGYTVVSDGPYRAVRHPAYVSAIVWTLATPPVLGSLWALIPAVTIAVLFVVRTALEDRTLQAELPGYADYAARTRYRLLPGLW